MNLLNQEKIKYRNICFTTEGRLRCRHIFTNWQFLLKMWNTFEHFLRYMLLTLERCCKPQRRFLIRLSIACFLDHPLLPGLNDMAWIGLHSIRVLQRVLVQIYIYIHITDYAWIQLGFIGSVWIHYILASALPLLSSRRNSNTYPL